MTLKKAKRKKIKNVVSVFKTLPTGGEIWKSFAVHNLERVSIHYAFSLIYTTTSSFNTTPGCVVCGNLITVTLFSEKNTAIQGNSIIIALAHQEKEC